MTDSIFNSCIDHSRRGKPLPAGAYTDESFFQQELACVFAAGWICIGVCNDVARVGDVFPISLAGSNLLITRADDNQIRVFHNYCLHRGMRLVDRACRNQKKLLCPYHSWLYKLDGSLIRTANIGGPQQHDSVACGMKLPEGLKLVRSAIWNGLIFADLSGNAQAFDGFIAPLAQQWVDYDFSLIHWATGATISAACNWKLAVENFVDVYHLPSVHQGLNAYSDYKDHYYIHQPTLFGEGNDNVNPDDIAVGEFDDFPNLPESRNTTLEALALFPNLLITVTRDHLRVIIVDPQGPNLCTERIHIFVNGEDAATNPGLQQQRQQLMQRFTDFNDEDLEITRRLQNSMQSSFSEGNFSPFFDESVRLFHVALVDALQQVSKN